jgi:hypothetical protein
MVLVVTSKMAGKWGLSLVVGSITFINLMAMIGQENHPFISWAYLLGIVGFIKLIFEILGSFNKSNKTGGLFSGFRSGLNSAIGSRIKPRKTGEEKIRERNETKRKLLELENRLKNTESRIRHGDYLIKDIEARENDEKEFLKKIFAFFQKSNEFVNLFRNFISTIEYKLKSQSLTIKEFLEFIRQFKSSMSDYMKNMVDEDNDDKKIKRIERLIGIRDIKKLRNELNENINELREIKKDVELIKFEGTSFLLNKDVKIIIENCNKLLSDFETGLKMITQIWQSCLTIQELTNKLHDIIDKRINILKKLESSLTNQKSGKSVTSINAKKLEAEFKTEYGELLNLYNSELNLLKTIKMNFDKFDEFKASFYNYLRIEYNQDQSISKSLFDLITKYDSFDDNLDNVQAKFEDFNSILEKLVEISEYILTGKKCSRKDQKIINTYKPPLVEYLKKFLESGNLIPNGKYKGLLFTYQELYQGLQQKELYDFLNGYLSSQTSKANNSNNSSKNNSSDNAEGKNNNTNGDNSKNPDYSKDEFYKNNVELSNILGQFNKMLGGGSIDIYDNNHPPSFRKKNNNLSDDLFFAILNSLKTSINRLESSDVEVPKTYVHFDKLFKKYGSKFTFKKLNDIIEQTFFDYKTLNVNLN